MAVSNARVRLAGITANSADDVWAVGRQGDQTGSTTTLAMHFDGTDWSVVPTPNPPDADNGASFEQVAAVGPSDAWAAGYAFGSDASTTSILEHWDGSNWSLVNGASGRHFVGPELLGVEAVAADDVWAVGGIGRPAKSYAEHYDGSSWTRITTENPYGKHTALTDVSAVATNDAWAVGYAPGRLRHMVFMHWNGDRWSNWP